MVTSLQLSQLENLNIKFRLSSFEDRSKTALNLHFTPRLFAHFVCHVNFGISNPAATADKLFYSRLRMDEQKTAASIDKQCNENSKTSISKEDDTITVIPFVKKAMDMLDQYSPFWRNCEPETTKTLNYPACLDVLENRVRVIDVKTSSNTAGQKGEDFVSALFQRLNLFGIVIAGFDSEQFYCKLMKESKKQIPSFARKALTVLCNEIKEVYNSRCFECEFLFFHPKNGLTIVEVKAREELKTQKMIHWKRQRSN
jgi:hypothetical protein